MSKVSPEVLEKSINNLVTAEGTITLAKPGAYRDVHVIREAAIEHLEHLKSNTYEVALDDLRMALDAQIDPTGSYSVVTLTDFLNRSTIQVIEKLLLTALENPK